MIIKIVQIVSKKTEIVNSLPLILIIRTMERIPVSSSNIVSVGYDTANNILEIEFHSGSIYEYRNVPDSVHFSLMSAHSHGSYFDREIRSVYPYVRIR